MHERRLGDSRLLVDWPLIQAAVDPGWLVFVLTNGVYELVDCSICTKVVYYIYSIPDIEQVSNLVATHEIPDVNNEWISREDLNLIFLLVVVQIWRANAGHLFANCLANCGARNTEIR
jgi:hypothetical protein